MKLDSLIEFVSKGGSLGSSSQQEQEREEDPSSSSSVAVGVGHGNNKSNVQEEKEGELTHMVADSDSNTTRIHTSLKSKQDTESKIDNKKKKTVEKLLYLISNEGLHEAIMSFTSDDSTNNADSVKMTTRKSSSAMDTSGHQQVQQSSSSNNNNNNNNNNRQLLEYLYYAGCAHIQLSNYREAFKFLHLCITLPCSQASVISMAAYKKWFLVGLILNGNLPLLPKYTSSIVTIASKQYGKSYEEFGHLLSIENVMDRYTKFKSEFQHDKNLALAQRAVHAVYLFGLIELESSFTTLSLNDAVMYLCLPRDSDIAIQSSILLIKQYLNHLVQENKISAQIMDNESLIVFDFEHDDTSSLNSTRTSYNANTILSKKLEDLIQFKNRIADLQRTVKLEVATTLKNRESGSASAEVQMDGGIDLKSLIVL